MESLLKGKNVETLIDIEEEDSDIQHVSPSHNENHDASGRMDGSKIEVLELIILLANFIVELMSIVFDQLSSQHKAPFLLLCLILSISAALISISELLYKLIKEWDFRKGKNWRSWLFDPPPGAGFRVGFFPCITALACAFGQCIITTVNYSLYRKDGNAPIKVSSSSAIFAFGQLFSSLSSRGAKTETKIKPESLPLSRPSPPEPRLRLRPMSLSPPLSLSQPHSLPPPSLPLTKPRLRLRQSQIPLPPPPHSDSATHSDSTLLHRMLRILLPVYPMIGIVPRLIPRPRLGLGPSKGVGSSSPKDD